MRYSNNQKNGQITKNGFDYLLQVWVKNYIIQKCGHKKQIVGYCCHVKKLVGKDIRKINVNKI